MFKLKKRDVKYNTENEKMMLLLNTMLSNG